jgi:hypothetical protein
MMNSISNSRFGAAVFFKVKKQFEATPEEKRLWDQTRPALEPEIRKVAIYQYGPTMAFTCRNLAPVQNLMDKLDRAGYDTELYRHAAYDRPSEQDLKGIGKFLHPPQAWEFVVPKVPKVSEERKTLSLIG